MKKIFSLIAFSILLFGCSEEFLDRQPEDTLAPGMFFKTPADIKTGVMPIYSHLQYIFDVAQLPYNLGQMSGDGSHMFSDSPWQSFYKDNTYSLTPIYSRFYKMIVNANNIIDIIDEFEPKSDADAVIVKAYRGEACFLRALAYFYLARLYGDIPKVVNRIDNPANVFGIGRTPVNSIYAEVVIPDLEYASANCYKKGDAALANGEARATQGAALTILGKVYLTMNDHSNAAATLKKLIVDKSAGNYSLLAEYSQIWLPSNKFNSESIFEVNYNVAAGMPSFYFRNMDINNGQNVYGLTTCNGRFSAEKNLMDEFVAYQDWTRYRVSVDSGGNPFLWNLIPFPLKLMPPLSGIQEYDIVGTDYNYMITRYADALLMYAEALMVLGQNDVAVGYVNQVRERVNMAPVAAADLDIDFILHERRMELSFEGHRYFDLVRTGKAIEYISSSLMSGDNYAEIVWRDTPIPEYQLILPIPVSEIEKDQTLTQNFGY